MPLFAAMLYIHIFVSYIHIFTYSHFHQLNNHPRFSDQRSLSHISQIGSLIYMSTGTYIARIPFSFILSHFRFSKLDFERGTEEELGFGNIHTVCIIYSARGGSRWTWYGKRGGPVVHACTMYLSTYIVDENPLTLDFQTRNSTSNTNLQRKLLSISRLESYLSAPTSHLLGFDVISIRINHIIHVYIHYFLIITSKLCISKIITPKIQ